MDNINEYSKSNEEVSEILKKATNSLEMVMQGISKKDDVETILTEIKDKIKEAETIMKNIEKEILIEKANLEEYYEQIREIYIIHTEDRLKIIEDTIRANVPDEIKTDSDISYGRIDNKEIKSNDLYNGSIEESKIYMFKNIMIKEHPKKKEEEKYICIGTIKIDDTEYKDNKQSNKIRIKTEHKDEEYKVIYDKYKVYPIINILNNSLLYKDEKK